jgi:hypothetical protein
VTFLDKAFRPDNLARAWRWVQSNPEAAYKSYYRSLYANYRIADDALLAGLRDRLTRGIYEPAHACKIYFPKKSGGLRPYTLLTVEDQIVYQALVNVVAEQLTPRVRHRQMSEVFSHIYAGKTSVWFYRYWKTGYQKMNRAVREAYREGFRYRARFDLTACYDSVDHTVLRHFLDDLGCDLDFNRLLIKCLARWTATQRKRRIYHGHGIPQGPLSSGLLAEAVLRHYDEGRIPRSGVRYFRYVDDIRLFARREIDLRRAVAELDYLSKDIGLFPQSAKIDIRKVADIEQELKSVSRPAVAELDLDAEKVDQKRVARRLQELTPKFRVTDSTEFRFVLGGAEPRARLSRRLVRVLEHQPYLYADILRYFRKYDSLPTDIAEWLTKELNSNPLYAAFIAELLFTADSRLDLFRSAEVDTYVKRNWKPSKLRSADLLAALGRWGIKRGVLARTQVEHAIRRLPEWWARSELVAALDIKTVDPGRVDGLLVEKLKDGVSDVAIAAAVHLSSLVTTITPPKSMHAAAGPVLEQLKLIPSGAAEVCGIKRSFDRLLRREVAQPDWKALFGKDYPDVERHTVFCYAYSEVNVTAWVNAMDVFNDWLLAALTAHDARIGTYIQGKVGTFVKQPTSRFAKHYPAVWAMTSEIHRCRGESHLSHAWQQEGQIYVKPTKPVPYKYLRKAKPLVERALAELSSVLPLLPESS